MTDQANAAPPRNSGWLLMLVGLIVPFMGIAAYALQLYLKRLVLPWYVPTAAIVGVALVAASLWKRRSVWRVVALGAVVGLAALELMTLNAMRLPAYNGPIAVGHPFPAFETRCADGTTFRQSDLIGNQNHAIVFFRGRW
jgi:hypothetical protein